MDETTKAIIDTITVRYPNPTTIPSGDKCTVFYDCIQLSPADLARLAAEATGELPEDTFEIVVGLAYTGIFFAAAVAGGRQVAILTHDDKLAGPPVKGRKVLVVDDVIHTGTRVKKARETIEKAGGIVVGYSCIVERSSKKSIDRALPVWSAVQAEMV